MAAAIEEGRKLLDSENVRCLECHDFHGGNDEPDAPDLTGYGSREWVKGIIGNPTHERFYGTKNDRMPAFKDEKILSDEAIGLIADWLRGDWYEPENETATPH